MTTAPKQIATPNQLATVIMGRLGKGFADRANLIGTIVDRGYCYTAADAMLDELLAAMVTRGLVEAVTMPSQYAAGQSWTAWRLPSKTPIEVVPPDWTPDLSRNRPGTITAAQFRAQGGKRKGGRG